jgi:transposase
MLSQEQRTTILELNKQSVSKREIARVLGISRVAARKVLRSNSTTVPELQRAEKAEPHRQQILELFDQCQGISCESMRSWWLRARSCRMPR